MLKFFIRWGINALSLLTVTYIFNGIRVHSVTALLVAALLLGLANTFIRPILLIVTFPLNILSLGLFTFFINGLLLLLVAYLVRGFEIDGFITGMLGAFVLSIISFTLSLLIGK